MPDADANATGLRHVGHDEPAAILAELLPRAAASARSPRVFQLEGPEAGTVRICVVAGHLVGVVGDQLKLGTLGATANRYRRARFECNDQGLLGRQVARRREADRRACASTCASTSCMKPPLRLS